MSFCYRNIPKGFVLIPAQLLKRMVEIQALADANRKKDVAK